MIYEHLIKSYPDVFTTDGALFYDRAAVLFSAQKQLKLDGSVLSNMDDDAEPIRVVIKKVADNFQVTSNDVPKAVSVRGIERDKCVLEVLNLAVSQEGYRVISTFVTYGSMHYLYDHRSFGFSDNVLPEFMDEKYMGVGLLKSVKVLEGDDGKCSPFVVTDVAKGAFHADEQNLLEKICQVSIFVDYRTGSSNFSVQTAFRPHFIRGILRLIKGLYVRTLYGKKGHFQSEVSRLLLVH